MKLRDDLTENVGETLGFHQIWPATSDIRQEAQLVKQFTDWHARNDNTDDRAD